MEREVSELLRGLHDFQRRQREKQNSQRQKLDASLGLDEAGANGRAVLEQRPIETDDVCAICQVERAAKTDGQAGLTRERSKTHVDPRFNYRKSYC